jgi:hypothetical protein
MTISILAFLLAAPSWAESPPEAPSEATPEATEEKATEIEKLPPPPQSLGQLTPERLMALRTYKSKRLQVRAETEYRGSSVATFTSMSYGQPLGLGTGVVVTDNISTFRTWGVYRGPQRLSTPDFLTLAGANAEREALVTDIRRLRSNARRWYIGAGIGVAGVVAGLVGMATAEDIETYNQFNRVSLGGTILTIGGLFGASFPGSKAERLYKYPGATLSSDQANDLAHAANEALRQELDIAPNEAWLLDLGAAE